MTDSKLDNKLAGALSTVVERYSDGNQFVSVENADKLVFDELERMGYLKNLSYDFSGNAIVIPTYKAVAYFQEENGAAIVAPRKNKQFETFGEAYVRVRGDWERWRGQRIRGCRFGWQTLCAQVAERGSDPQLF